MHWFAFLMEYGNPEEVQTWAVSTADKLLHHLAPVSWQPPHTFYGNPSLNLQHAVHDGILMAMSVEENMSNRTCAYPLLVPELGVYKAGENSVSSPVHSTVILWTLPKVSLFSSIIEYCKLGLLWTWEVLWTN